MMFSAKRIKLLEAKLARTISQVQIIWKTRFEALEKTDKRLENNFRQEQKSNSFKWGDILGRLNLLEQIHKKELKLATARNHRQEVNAAKEVEKNG